LLSALANAVPNASLDSSLLSIKNITWQELEALEPKFLQLLVSIQLHGCWTWSRVSGHLVCAKARANILQMPTVFEIGTEKQQWIIETKEKYTTKNFPIVDCEN
jgi:hypothetical protein